MIEDDSKEMATPEQDWREKMTMKPELLVPVEELIQPIDDIWED